MKWTLRFVLVTFALGIALLAAFLYKPNLNTDPTRDEIRVMAVGITSSPLFSARAPELLFHLSGHTQTERER
jgi:hypothetical protein